MSEMQNASWTRGLTHKNLRQRVPELLECLQTIIDLWDENDDVFIRGLTRKLGLRILPRDTKETLKMKILRSLPISEDVANEVDPLTMESFSTMLPQMILRYKDARGFDRVASFPSLQVRRGKIINLSTQSEVPLTAYGDMIEQIALIEKHFGQWLPEREDLSYVKRQWRDFSKWYSKLGGFERGMIEAILGPLFALYAMSMYEFLINPLPDTVAIYLMLTIIVAAQVRLMTNVVRFAGATYKQALIGLLAIFAFVYVATTASNMAIEHFSDLTDPIRETFERIATPFVRGMSYVSPYGARLRDGGIPS